MRYRRRGGRRGKKRRRRGRRRGRRWKDESAAGEREGDEKDEDREGCRDGEVREKKRERANRIWGYRNPTDAAAESVWVHHRGREKMEELEIKWTRKRDEGKKKNRGRKWERGRERLKRGRGMRLADVIRRLYQALAGEESAVKREVCHWLFVLAKQEENTFVKAAAWWGDKWLPCIFSPRNSLAAAERIHIRKQQWQLY